ncbi:MAG: aryl-sulfate sulfotransferase, partial [Flavobacteriales bacterium]|nr:aryl-sulfate sulfotransferase [Flavobacteriales bacterium]
AWDHLVQDFDSSKANFGVVANLKGKLDINKGHPFNLADWAHVNALDYNDSLDQIVMSSPFFNELWIIDHSTTTSEAATDQGGNSGMGGQILWRWGNPMSYDRGDLLDQELFFQHDCEWVKEGSRFRNLISVFSNRDTINGQLGSIVKVLDPEYDTLTKTYPQTSAGIYFPQQPTYTYELVDTLFSPRVSGAQFLANDNILICSGVNGHVLEIDSSEQEVWEYIVPIDQAGVIVPQGTYLNLPTSLFNIKRYPVNYIGFSGLNMTAGNTIETGQSNCGLLTNTKTDGQDQMNFNVYPNPVQGVLNVSSEHYGNFIITDVFGKQVRLGQIKPGTTKLDVRYLSPGIYNITLINERIRESRLISVAY